MVIASIEPHSTSNFWPPNIGRSAKKRYEKQGDWGADHDRQTTSVGLGRGSGPLSGLQLVGAHSKSASIFVNILLWHEDYYSCTQSQGMPRVVWHELTKQLKAA